MRLYVILYNNAPNCASMREVNTMRLYDMRLDGARLTCMRLKTTPPKYSGLLGPLISHEKMKCCEHDHWCYIDKLFSS